MHWILWYAFIYVFGGLTFIPLLIFLILYYLSISLPIIPNDDDNLKNELEQIEINKNSKLKNELEGYRNLKSGYVIEKEDMGIKCYYSGWLTVTKEFYQFPQIDPNSYQQNNTVNNTDFTNNTGNNENNQNHKSSSASSSSSSSSFSFSKMMKTASVAVTGGSGSNYSSNNNQTHNNSNNHDSTNSEENYDDDLSSQNNNLDAKKLKAIRRKNRYYAVLKHGNLFLYSDETKSNVQHAIVLANHFVTIWPRNLRDGQLFTKKSAICIMKKDDVDTSEPSSESSSTATTTGAETTIHTINENNVTESGASINTLKKKKSTISLNPSIKDNKIPPSPKDAFFLYGDVNHEKEDWYFTLLRASSNLDSYKNSSSQNSNNNNNNNNKEKLEPSIYARPLHYYTADMIDLIQTINATEGQLTTKWLNALIGRLFLSVYQTDDFEAYIRANIENKIQKIKTPGFLDDIVIRKLDVGHSAPSLTFPKLKTLSPEGELQVESNFLYQGGLTVEVSTKLFVNLGSRFRTREFPVNLKVKVKKVQGIIILRIKPPPSNRIWWSYAKMPHIELDIEPVISARALSYNLINNIITNRFKEAIRASVVMPFMDDIVFQRTTNETFRGGIWDTKSRPKASFQAHTANVANNNNENNDLDSTSPATAPAAAPVSNPTAVAAAVLATNSSTPSVSISSPTKKTTSTTASTTNKSHPDKQPSIASFDTIDSTNTNSAPPPPTTLNVSQQSTSARKISGIPPQLPDRPLSETVSDINSHYAESINSTDVNSIINDEKINKEISPIIDEEQNDTTNNINNNRTPSLDFEYQTPSLSPNQLTNLENDSKTTINSTESKRIRKLKTQASLLTKKASSIMESKANAFMETTTSNSSSAVSPSKDETKDDPYKETNATLNKYAETVSSSMYKLKGWYNKEKKSFKSSEENETSSTTSSDSKKKKPEMITNRRQTRKSSNNSISNDSSFRQSLAAPIPEDFPLNSEPNSMKLSDSINSNSFTNSFEPSPIEFSNSSRGSTNVSSQQPPLQNMMLAPNYNADDYNTTTSNSANMFINQDNQKSFRSSSFGSPRTPTSFYNGFEDHDQLTNSVNKELIVAEQAQLKSDTNMPNVEKPELPSRDNTAIVAPTVTITAPVETQTPESMIHTPDPETIPHTQHSIHKRKAPPTLPPRDDPLYSTASPVTPVEEQKPDAE
ncbi:hypothetical protein B5S29_g3203 [[Candida] boidinii]|nr:hypothetical protein B5S29_g3203 [[Candida] boidinii]